MFQDNFKIWFSNISPEINLKKLNIKKNNRNLIIGLMLFLLLVISALVGGFLLRKKQLLKEQNEVGQTIIDCIRKAFSNFSYEDYNNLFINDSINEEFLKIKSYVHKRMSMGIIFQESLPFPALLLDQDLYVLWKNKNFDDLFKLDNNANLLHWDNIRSNFILEEGDIVTNALSTREASVHSIEINKGDDETNFSYEMYISTIEKDSRLWVMIFLYPMIVSKQINDSHTNNILGLIKKSLENMSMNNNIGHNMQEDINREFNQVGLSNLAKNINDIGNIISNNKNIIKNLNEKVEHNNSIHEEIKSILLKSYNSNKKIIKNITNLKKCSY